jgi:DNA-binding transcriptional regulator YiaG
VKVVTLKDALEHFDSKAELAAALGITKQAVSAWGMNDPIPERRRLKLNHEIIPNIVADTKQTTDRTALAATG